MSQQFSGWPSWAYLQRLQADGSLWSGALGLSLLYPISHSAPAAKPAAQFPHKNAQKHRLVSHRRKGKAPLVPYRLSIETSPWGLRAHGFSFLSARSTLISAGVCPQALVSFRTWWGRRKTELPQAAPKPVVGQGKGKWYAFREGLSRQEEDWEKPWLVNLRWWLCVEKDWGLVQLWERDARFLRSWGLEGLHHGEVLLEVRLVMCSFRRENGRLTVNVQFVIITRRSWVYWGMPRWNGKPFQMYWDGLNNIRR